MGYEPHGHVFLMLSKFAEYFSLLGFNCQASLIFHLLLNVKWAIYFLSDDCLG